MKIQSALLAATFLAALSFTPPAQAATIPPNILKLLVELGYLAPLTGVTLTSAQITQIETIEITGWEALLPQLKIVVTTHEEIIGQLAQPKVSVSAIRAFEKQKAAALAIIETKRIKMAIAVHNLLTPAQITQEAATHVTQVEDLIALIQKYCPECGA